jgi:hypothetical protein
VGVQVVPHHHQRAAELLVRGVQQLRVAGLGEALAPLLAVVHAVDQPGAVAWLDADKRSQ